MENRVRFFNEGSCYPTGAEGGCDIKTACMGIDIEDFSCKV